MPTSCPWWCRLALVLLALGVVMPQSAEAAKRALLVGVGDYADHLVSDLQGPPHDVAVLRDALVQHGSFAAEAITVLLARRGILEAIERLGQASESGDFVLIYLSGHGTSAFNPGLILPLPHPFRCLRAGGFRRLRQPGGTARLAGHRRPRPAPAPAGHGRQAGARPDPHRQLLRAVHLARPACTGNHNGLSHTRRRAGKRDLRRPFRGRSTLSLPASRHPDGVEQEGGGG